MALLLVAMKNSFLLQDCCYAVLTVPELTQTRYPLLGCLRRYPPAFPPAPCPLVPMGQALGPLIRPQLVYGSCVCPTPCVLIILMAVLTF